jgi:hypothetical protein
MWIVDGAQSTMERSVISEMHGQVPFSTEAKKVIVLMLINCHKGSYRAGETPAREFFVVLLVLHVCQVGQKPVPPPALLLACLEALVGDAG